MTNVLDAYRPQLNAWLPKFMGSKPTADQLTVAHYFGRPGKQSLALAMAMRPEGVTAGQINMACGNPQNNHRRGLITEGLFKRDMNVPANEQGHTVYKITLSTKGEAAIKKATATAATATLPAEPAKNPNKGKAKLSVTKPKTKKPAPDMATELAAPVTETATETPTPAASASNGVAPHEGSGATT